MFGGGREGTVPCPRLCKRGPRHFVQPERPDERRGRDDLGANQPSAVGRSQADWYSTRLSGALPPNSRDRQWAARAHIPEHNSGDRQLAAFCASQFCVARLNADARIPRRRVKQLGIHEEDLPYTERSQWMTALVLRRRGSPNECMHSRLSRAMEVCLTCN
jgi:hypothetical protein